MDETEFLSKIDNLLDGLKEQERTVVPFSNSEFEDRAFNDGLEWGIEALRIARKLVN